MLRFHKIFNFINRYHLCQIDFQLDELSSDTGYLSLEQFIWQLVKNNLYEEGMSPTKDLAHLSDLRVRSN